MRQEKFIILLFGWLFLGFSFFPYINLLGLNTTTQPNALFFSVFPLVFIKLNRSPKELFIFGIVSAFATFILLLSDLSFLSFRDWANYMSLFFVSFGAYKFLRYINGLPYKFFYSVVCIWLLVGVIQMFLNPNFLSLLFYKMRGAFAAGRGVTGLSTEPTYYGLMLGLFFVIYLINNWYNRSKLLGFLILFQLVFLSRSTTAIFIFILTLGVFSFILLFRLNLKSILSISVLSIIITIFMALTIDLYKELRIYKVSQVILVHPEIVLATDFSVSERVNHIIFPIISLVDGVGLPRGYGKFNDYLLSKKENKKYKAFFSHPFEGGSNRILSGHGKGFFELGAVGLLISIGLFSAFRFGFSNPQFLFGFILYFLLLFASLPFMTATVPFIIGNVLYLKHEKNKTTYL
jgi:hypothetical protein